MIAVLIISSFSIAFMLLGILFLVGSFVATYHVEILNIPGLIFSSLASILAYISFLISKGIMAENKIDLSKRNFILLFFKYSHIPLLVSLLLVVSFLALIIFVGVDIPVRQFLK